MYTGLRNTLRLMRIARVFFLYDLGEFVSPGWLYRLLRVILCPTTVYSHSGKRLLRGHRLRKALEELGPVFIKFGQMLSTRPDLIPDDVVIELTRLQDNVPSFPGTLAIELIERAYSESLDVHFSTFEAEPIASASVAQVHQAQLQDGTEVVVKVLRPDIEKVINRDIRLLYTVANFAEKHFSEGRRLRAIELVDEYNKTIHDELDLMREASNASKLRSNFENSPIIYVPKIFWEHTRQNVMVMERVSGIPIRDLYAIHEAKIDVRELAHNGVEIFFTQAFRDGFFHADMHPGNIFVGPNGQYRAVDFGIMGTLGDRDKRYLAENFLAFFNRDYRMVAEAHIRAGWVPRETRVDEFEAAIRTVCEPIFAKPISEISFARLIVRLFQTARRFNMPIQPQLVLLQKTLFNIEGLGRQLYPELDLWETAKPYLERWMKEQIGPSVMMRDLRRELPRLALLVPKLSQIGNELLQHSHDERQIRDPAYAELLELSSQIKRQHAKLFRALAGCAMLSIGTFGLVIGLRPGLDYVPSWWVSGALIMIGILALISSFAKMRH